VHAIQAVRLFLHHLVQGHTKFPKVKRAILMWRTGQLVTPPRPLGNYSRSNWGDKIEVREGQQVHVKTASMVLKLVSKLKPKQWQKILDSALEFCKVKEAVVAHEGSIEVDSGSDFEIVDNDDDLKEDLWYLVSYIAVHSVVLPSQNRNFNHVLSFFVTGGPL